MDWYHVDLKEFLFCHREFFFFFPFIVVVVPSFNVPSSSMPSSSSFFEN